MFRYFCSNIGASTFRKASAETMAPQDFLDFRNFLTPASGFQSFQFRALEIRLGLKMQQRIKFSQHAYHEHFSEVKREDLLNLEKEHSLFDLLETWLERTPFLERTGFNFAQAYRKAVDKMLNRDISQFN